MGRWISRRRLLAAVAGGVAGVRGRPRELLLAAVGHALDFTTWRSLVRGRGLEEEMAVELMVRLVRGAAWG